ncbi:MAG TPA: POTRA domain-containing protein [Fontimonas sp.]
MNRIGIGVRLAAAILLFIGQNALAAGEPRITEITFEGNDRTQASVLRREIPIAVGDVLDADLVELSRQQIQNLGLFRAVEARVEAVDGGVRLVFNVKEKWFWQGYPRLSANSDGQNSIGFEGRVSNLWGLNHSLRVLGRSRDTKDEDRGRDLSIRGSYYAPYLLGERDSLRLSAAHSITPYEDPDYDETVNEVEALASRTFGLPQQHSQGWTLGVGTIWRDQQISDESIARSFGSSYGLVTEATYRNERDLIYSNEGSYFSARYEIADQDLFSDYSYSILRVSAEQARPIGTRAHQQLSYGLTFGVGNHALDHRALFSLGGAEGLRGYERKAFEGNSFYLGNIEFMRPLYWDSLRGTIGLELGNAAWETRDLFNSPNLSLNLGLRYKPRRLINFEIELGFAIPLSGEDPRFYGGKVDRH